MTQLGKIFVIVAYGISIIFLPWWVSVALAVILLGVWQAYASVIVGALLLDIVFGAPLFAFSGFSYLYTLIFVVLVAVTFVLARAMLE
jgi:K+-sensing histidine kinase KdpD